MTGKERERLHNLGKCPCGRPAKALIRTQEVCKYHFEIIQKDNLFLLSIGEDIPNKIPERLIDESN